MTKATALAEAAAQREKEEQLYLEVRALQKEIADLEATRISWAGDGITRIPRHLPAGTDCNTITSSGWYGFDQPASPNKPPMNGWVNLGVVRRISLSSTHIQQVAWDIHFTINAVGWTRKFLPATGWSEWQLISPTTYISSLIAAANAAAGRTALGVVPATNAVL